MIRMATFAMLLLILGRAPAAQGEDIKLNPGNGTLRCEELDKPNALRAAFPFPSTERKSFTARVKLEVGTWNHYGSIRIGFKSSKFDDRFEAVLTKGDDGLRSVAMDVEVAGGTSFRATLGSLPPDVKTFTLAFQYSEPRNRFKMTVSHDARIFGESDWTKLRGFFTLDEFFVQVSRGKAGLTPGSSISWDPKDSVLRAVSHPGNEGHYQYLMEAAVKEASIQTE